MTIGVLKEMAPEKRVAVVPEIAKSLINLKTEVLIESGAGINAHRHDEEYLNIGAKIKTRNEVLTNSDYILSISGITIGEIDTWGERKVLIGHLNHGNTAFIDKLIRNKITSFSLDLLPRNTLAQSMDILSSMATISGYKAVLDAALNLPRFFPMFMAASGTIKPARILILGAGVAGLQALATARRLGALVDVFDVRSAVKEEVHSLGGKFIEVEGAAEDISAGGYAIEQSEDFKRRQSELIQKHAENADVIICTAQIPGKKAPILIAGHTVNKMKPGSVIVDLAAPSGGNCELTVNNDVITQNEVSIIGKVDYPALLSSDASIMFSNNLYNFTRLLIDTNGIPTLNWSNDLIKSTCITHDGKMVNERIKSWQKIG